MAFAEYLWLDGGTPRGLRSKTRIVDAANDDLRPQRFAEWTFDGSCTGQAGAADSDRVLRPVCVARDPAGTDQHYLVLCEVFNADGTEHVSNTRSELRAVLASGAEVHDAWIGYEQQYTLMRHGRVLGFSGDDHASASGSHYCNVGAGSASGRDIAETHTRSCDAAGLMICGMNAEAQPGQWEFQIGYRARRGEVPSLLEASDHLWLARYVLHRVAERAGAQVSFQRNPQQGECSGLGLHANFSSAAMRAEGGICAIHAAIEPLAHAHERHIAVHGDRFEGRSSGSRESCSIFEFKAGGADRGASIRIPLAVQLRGSGYFQDRRPSADADPYQVAARLAATIFGIDVHTPGGVRASRANKLSFLKHNAERVELSDRSQSRVDEDAVGKRESPAPTALRA